MVGYGAGAINPYLVFETFENIIGKKSFKKNFTLEKAIQNYLNAIRKGMFKVFSKMGISTIQSYRGAQVFEAVGLEDDLIEEITTASGFCIKSIDYDIQFNEEEPVNYYQGA